MFFLAGRERGINFNVTNVERKSAAVNKHKGFSHFGPDRAKTFGKSNDILMDFWRE